MPVVPVLVSWIISTVTLYRSMNLANASEQGTMFVKINIYMGVGDIPGKRQLSHTSSGNSFNARKRRASVTILIVTFIYLLFNIPVLIHMVLMILIAFNVSWKLSRKFLLWFLVIFIANSNRFKPFFNVLRQLSFIFYELVISDTTSWIISVQTWAWFISRHKQECNLVQWRRSECNAQPSGLLLSVSSANIKTK